MFWLTVLVAFWALLGMTGRDAWKAEEAVALGQVMDWLAVGGLPAASSAPLYTLLAGISARLLSGWLDVQDAARLASAVFVLATLLFTARAARAFLGLGFGAAATLALVGAFGLMLRAHALLPETALLMGYALLLLGVGRAREGGATAAPAMGLGILAIVLSRGVPDLVAGLAIILLPLAFPAWREAPYRRSLLAGLAWLAGGLALWGGLLAVQGDLAMAWQVASAPLAPERGPGFILANLAWFAWPIWPLAVWTLWHQHRRLGRATELQPLLTASLVLFVLAHWPSYSREGGALPLLVPLALLAAHGVDSLKRGAAQSFYWFGALCFLFFTLAFWVYFSAIQWQWPAGLAAHMARLTPDYAFGSVDAQAIRLAAAATLLWLVALPLFPRAKIRPVLVWATGMMLSWVLLMTLFKPWAEAGWAYRPVIRDMARHLPAGACVEAQVDPAMAAMLRLHLANPVRQDGHCAYRLVSGERDAERRMCTPDEQLLWSGARPRYKQQRYRLYALYD